ncbi:MAG: hypothetical protein R2848_15380 [Thermomicrobiales bacterium]
MTNPFTERVLELVMAFIMGVSTLLGAVTQSAIAPNLQGTTTQTAARTSSIVGS